MSWKNTPSPHARALTRTDRQQFHDAVFTQHGNTCTHCGQPATIADHIVPISQGGQHHVTNGQPLCKPCHDTKTAHESATARRGRTHTTHLRPTERHPGLQ